MADTLAQAAGDLLMLAYQYRDDLKRPPDDDSRERRLKRIDEVIAKVAPPYGRMCRDPNLCAGKGYCPRDPTCGD